MSPHCDACGADRLLYVTDQPRWESRAGIERYECLRCGTETTIEPPRPLSRGAPAP